MADINNSVNKGQWLYVPIRRETIYGRLYPWIRLVKPRDQKLVWYH